MNKYVTTCTSYIIHTEELYAILFTVVQNLPQQLTNFYYSPPLSPKVFTRAPILTYRLFSLTSISRGQECIYKVFLTSEQNTNKSKNLTYYSVWVSGKKRKSNYQNGFEAEGIKIKHLGLRQLPPKVPHQTCPRT